MSYWPAPHLITLEDAVERVILSSVKLGRPQCEITGKTGGLRMVPRCEGAFGRGNIAIVSKESMRKWPRTAVCLNDHLGIGVSGSLPPNKAAAALTRWVTAAPLRFHVVRSMEPEREKTARVAIEMDGRRAVLIVPGDFTFALADARAVWEVPCVRLSEARDSADLVSDHRPELHAGGDRVLRALSQWYALFGACPSSRSPNLLDEFMENIKKTAAELGPASLFHNEEYYKGLARPELLSATARSILGINETRPFAMAHAAFRSHRGAADFSRAEFVEAMQEMEESADYARAHADASKAFDILERGEASLSSHCLRLRRLGLRPKPPRALRAKSPKKVIQQIRIRASAI